MRANQFFGVLFCLLLLSSASAQLIPITSPNEPVSVISPTTSEDTVDENLTTIEPESDSEPSLVESESKNETVSAVQPESDVEGTQPEGVKQVEPEQEGSLIPVQPVEEEQEGPRIIVQPKVREIINKRRRELVDPVKREKVKEEVKNVVKEKKLRIALELDKSCSGWSLQEGEVLKRIETDEHIFLLSEVPAELIPVLVSDDCVLRLSDEEGLRLFIRHVRKELVEEAEEKTKELDLKEKRGVTLDQEELRNKIEQEVGGEELPPVEEEYNITSNERIGYQAFITPDDSLVQSAVTSSSEAAYQQAVGWVWISDSALHGESENWMKPGAFLQSDELPDNPTGELASDCSEQANTLVSVLRAQGVSANDVKVVLGQVNFEGSVSGHAWVELKQDDGTWMPLEVTSGPIYEGGEVRSSSGLPFEYWKYHEYPMVDRWVEYNDVFFVDYETGRTNAPSSWSTSELSGPESSLTFDELPRMKDLEAKFTTSLFCEYQGHLVHAEETRLKMNAVISYLNTLGMSTSSLSEYKGGFVSCTNSLADTAESNNEAAYESKLEECAGYAEDFKTELDSLVQSGPLSRSSLRSAVQARLETESSVLSNLRSNRLKYCKRVSVQRFQKYLGGLEEDARRFKSLGCEVSNLDDVVETVSTYEAYLENYMSGGYEAGVDEIQTQIISLHDQLVQLARTCYRNKLVEDYNKLWEVVNELSDKGISVGDVPDELNSAADNIKSGKIDLAREQLASVRDTLDSKIREAGT